MKENENLNKQQLFPSTVFILCLLIFFCSVPIIKIIRYDIVAYFRNNKEIVALEETSVIENEILVKDEEKVSDRKDTILDKIWKMFSFADNIIEEMDIKWNNFVFRRDSLSEISSKITFLMTGEIQSVQVLQGKNGWLFYKTESDGDTIGDYTGSNYFSDEDRADIYDSLNAVQSEMKKAGMEFCVIIPPNKENVYYQYMPDTYRHAKLSRTDLLIEYLQGKDINILNVKEELGKYCNKYQLYYSYDTHWNQIGGYLGSKYILDFWNFHVTELDDCDIIASPLHGMDHNDLAGMVNLKKYFTDDMEFRVNETYEIPWDLFYERQESKGIGYLENIDAKEKNTVLFLKCSCKIFQEKSED